MQKRLSTLDIIADKLTCDQLASRCNTGDILLAATPCQDKSLAFRVLISVGGRDSLERRMPVVHAATIIKNPPQDVLDTFGLQQDLCRTGVYVLESTSSHPDGAILTPLSKWIEDELNPLFFGSKVLYRRRKSPRQVHLSQDFWNYVKESRTIPYIFGHAHEMPKGSHHLYNLAMAEGAILSTVMMFTEIATHNAMTLLFGSNPLGLFLASILGFALIPLSALWASCIMLPTIIKHFSTIIKNHGLVRVIDETVYKNTCSSLVAAILVKANLLSKGDHCDESWFHPRDFLPQSIGKETNLLDDNLKEGVFYSEQLVEVDVAPRKRGSIWESFTDSIIF